MADREETDDIRGDLLAAITTVETATPGSTGGMADVAKSKAPPAPVTGSPALDGADKNKSAPTVSDENRVRGADGKFLPVAAKDKSGVEAKASPDKNAEKPLDAAEPGAEGKEADKTATDPDAAPGSLPGALKLKWSTLDPDAKKYIRAQEQRLGTIAGTHGDQIKQLKTQLDEYEPVIGPRRGALTANYGGIGPALKRMFDLSDFAGQDPKGFVSWFAQQSGIDLAALIGQPAQGAAAQGSQPAATLPPEVLQRINGLESKFQETERQQQQARLNDSAAEISAVAQELDAQGNHVRPFFEELRQEIGPLLSIIKQQNPSWSVRQVTSAAYDKAIRMNDDVWSRVSAAKDQSETQKREAEARAEAAQRARKSTGGDPPNRYSGGGESVSLRDEIAKNFYAVTGGPSRL